MSGTVVSLPDGRTLGAHFLFEPDPGQDPDLPRRIRVGWYLDRPPPDAATRWILALRMRAPRGGVNPKAFDYERWLTARGIGATATVADGPEPHRLGPVTGRALLAMRARLDRALRAALGDHPRAAIVRGLALGERGGIGPDEWEIFARTGTAHLMAISGMHVGMVASLVFGVIGAIARRWDRLVDFARPLAVGAGLAAATTYAALAGFAVPTRRALVMLAAAAVILLARREGVAAAAWIAALVAVTAGDPLSPLTIGYWLSFGAVAFIAWHAHGRRTAPSAPVALCRAQWAVAIGLLPLTLWFFQRGSLVAPLANLAAIPAFTLVVVPATLVGASLSVIAPAFADPWLGTLLGVLDRLWSGLVWLSDLPWAQRFSPRPPLAATVAALLGAAVVLAPRGWPGRWPVGAAICLPMLLYRPDPPPPGGWHATVLDVGQGLAVVVRTHTRTLLYDTGPSFGPEADAGSRIVVPYLRATGIARIDTLVISHAHDDHGGGARSVLRALPVGRHIGARADACVAGERWRWDDVAFRVLHPPDPPPRDINLSSCVLEVAGPGGRLLLPGDIEWPVELELARPGGPLQRAEVVIVPHHGSRTSSIPRFVARTHPGLAIVPAGFANRWGLPHPSVVERWSGVGARVLTVGVAGAISVRADPRQGIGEVIIERSTERPWWRVE